MLKSKPEFLLLKSNKAFMRKLLFIPLALILTGAFALTGLGQPHLSALAATIAKTTKQQTTKIAKKPALQKPKPTATQAAKTCPNMDCLLASANTCAPSRFTYTREMKYEDLELTMPLEFTRLLEIRGKDTKGKCTLYTKNVKIKVLFPPDVSQEKRPGLEHFFKATEGMEATCAYDIKTVKERLAKEKRGLLPSTYNPPECTTVIPSVTQTPKKDSKTTAKTSLKDSNPRCPTLSKVQKACKGSPRLTNFQGIPNPKLAAKKGFRSAMTCAYNVESDAILGTGVTAVMLETTSLEDTPDLYQKQLPKGNITVYGKNEVGEESLRFRYPPEMMGATLGLALRQGRLIALIEVDEPEICPTEKLLEVGKLFAK